MDGGNHRLGVVGAGDLDDERESLVVGGGGDVHPELVVLTGGDLHGQGDALLSCRGEGHLVAATGHLLLRVASIEFRFVSSRLWICRFKHLDFYSVLLSPSNITKNSNTKIGKSEEEKNNKLNI